LITLIVKGPRTILASELEFSNYAFYLNCA